MPGSIVQLLATLIQLYSYVLLARIVLSWIPNVDRTNQIVQVLYQVTEPVLEPVRRVVPRLGMMDISPIVVFIGLHILQRILLSLAVGG
ncbi:MAG: YggT family protein [Rhodothermia bacterium]